jgi:hypothetical protein
MSVPLSNHANSKAIQIIGMLLMLFSIGALLISHFWMVRDGYVDFPCWALGPENISINSNTKMIYCLSYIPRFAKSGGGIYAKGSAGMEEVVLKPQDNGFPSWHGTLSFIVKHSFLKVSSKGSYVDLIAKDENFTRVRIKQSSNPWLLLTVYFRLTNLGTGDKIDNYYKQPNSDEILYVGGDVIENWLPSPIGFALYSLGLNLLLAGHYKTNTQNKISTPIAVIVASLMQTVGWLILGAVFFALFYYSPKILYGSIAQLAGIALVISWSLVYVGWFIVDRRLALHSNILNVVLKTGCLLIAFFIFAYLIL